MRCPAVLFALPFAMAGVVSPTVAWATDCASLLSPCINDDVLWPHAGPARLEAVGSTETLAASQLGFAFVASYLSRPIVINDPAPGGAGSAQYAVDNQVNGTFLWSFGVSDRLELDLALPLTLGQGGTGLAPVTGGDGLKDTAVRDLRFGFAYALVPAARGDGWGLAARLEVSAPTGDRSQFAGERSGVFVPGLAADCRLDRWFAGAELGARVRPTTELLGARIGTQIVAEAGVGYEVLRHEMLSAALEAWALPTLSEQADVLRQGGALVSQPNGGHIVPAEWQLSARTVPVRGGDFAIQLGGGGGIPLGSESATTTPRFRFTLAVRWAPHARTGAAAAPRPSEP